MDPVSSLSLGFGVDSPIIIYGLEGLLKLCR